MLLRQFKVKTKFDHERLIHECHKNQEKVFREIIKMDGKSCVSTH